MQLTVKHIITISVVAIIAMLGYSGLHNSLTTSPSDRVKLSTGVISSISQSGIEIDTLKRPETVASSGTQWGLSPFGRGKPLTETDKKPEFKKPNTEWKTRTLNINGKWLTYVFGEGNPAGVAMNIDQIKEISKICADGTSPEAQKLINTQVCSQESGLMAYVTPEVETYLLAALSDPNWSKLATECEKNFRAIENADSSINAQNDSEYPLFDRVFSPRWLDMDRYLYIDPDTGLKLLKWGRVNVLAGFLTSASHYGTRKDDGSINPHGDCVDQYGTEIARNLYSVLDLYKNPTEFIH